MSVYSQGFLGYRADLSAFEHPVVPQAWGLDGPRSPEPGRQMVYLAQVMFRAPELAVGWLSPEHKFETCESQSAEWVERLATHSASRSATIQYARALSLCPFCPSSTATSVASGEVFVAGQGVVYRVPSLLVHFVREHGYAPPATFVEACLSPSMEQALSEFERLPLPQYASVPVEAVDFAELRKHFIALASSRSGSVKFNEPQLFTTKSECHFSVRYTDRVADAVHCWRVPLSAFVSPTQAQYAVTTCLAALDSSRCAVLNKADELSWWDELVEGVRGFVRR